MHSIIVPKRWVSTQAFWNDTRMRPFLFFMGPIRGGGDWQADMAGLALKHKRLEQSVIACPCRWDETDRWNHRFFPGPTNVFERQLDWEQHYLELAGVGRGPGCIVCYLPLESKTEPHPGPEPYGMDTRGELGEWRMRMKYENARLVVGAHPDFFGLSQIGRNFSKVLGYDFPIYSSMEETLDAAARTIRSHYR